MGYCISLKDYDLKIKKENANKALEALKELVKGYIKNKVSPPWITFDEVLNAKTLSEATDYFYWTLSKNDDGDYDKLDFTGEKLYDDEDMFRSLAPFVESGSYVEIHGEEDTWRWVFDGRSMKEVYPVLD